MAKKLSYSSEASLAYVFRTPLSNAEDWTLAMRWNRATNATDVILHGLLDEERVKLLDRVADSTEDICHPMLLPVILCEMLTDGDANGIRA